VRGIGEPRVGRGRGWTDAGTDIRVTIEPRPACSTDEEWLPPYLNLLPVFADCTRFSSFDRSFGAKSLPKPRSGNLSQIHYNTKHCRRYESVSLRPLTPSKQAQYEQAQFQSGLSFPRATGHSHGGSGRPTPRISGGQRKRGEYAECLDDSKGASPLR